MKDNQWCPNCGSENTLPYKDKLNVCNDCFITFGKRSETTMLYACSHAGFTGICSKCEDSIPTVNMVKDKWFCSIIAENVSNELYYERCISCGKKINPCLVPPGQYVCHQCEWKFIS